jgi:ABC-type branched-subunit amino acid transport system substrate-binding protein
MEPVRSVRRLRALAGGLALLLALTVAGCTSDTGDDAGPAGIVDTGGPTVAAGNCDGLKNGTGVTDKEITIANASDISGFVPGLFAEAQLAVKAYVKYFNAAQDICGRKLAILPLDSRLDAGGDRQAAATACDKAFALVGSEAAFDNGGASAVKSCGIPDLRTNTLSAQRASSPTTFATNAMKLNLQPGVVPEYFAKKYPDAVKNAAFLYLNAGAAANSAPQEIDAWKTKGFNWVYTQPLDVFETNYTSYVLAMKKKNVKFVQFIGNYANSARLATTMAAQNFKPDIYLLDPSGYDHNYILQAGPAADGTRIFINSALFEEADKNKEMQRYVGWLQKVDSSVRPTYFGLFAWSAARLFTELATKLGGKLTRETFVEALKGVHDWDGHGLFAPQDVGGRKTGNCTSIIRLKGRTWVRESGKDWLCAPLVDTSTSAG